MNKKMKLVLEQPDYKKIIFRLYKDQYYQVKKLTKDFALVDEFFTLLVEKFLSNEILSDYEIRTNWIKVDKKRG